MERRFIYLFLGLVGIIAIYYWARGVVMLDPDFGWHIRMGQIILSNGIPATDPFSYSMPSYPVVGHEWLTDILLAWLLPVIGYKGLAGIFTFISLGALVLQWKAVRKQQRQFVFIPFFLSLTTLVFFFGIRPQVISWFFFSLILFVVRDRERFRKWRWWLPVVFLVWANLHGGFPLGIGVLLAAIVYWATTRDRPYNVLHRAKTWFRPYKNKFSVFSAGAVFLLCIGATFITPYGRGNWWEVWMTMTDSSLRWAIQEWMPAIFSLIFSFWVYFAFSVFLVIRYIKRYTLLDIFLYFGFLAAAFSSVRHIPLWAIVSLPVTTQGLFFLYREAAKIQYGKIRLGKALKGFFVIICFVILLGVVEFLVNMPKVLVNADSNTGYPDKAVSYLRRYIPKGEVFSSYNWGGYLIWKLQEKKVFIDGRMPSWRWKAHIRGESDYAFEEYGKFLNGELAFRSFTSKYGISTLLVPVEDNSKQTELQKQIASLDNFVKKSLHMKPEKEAGFSNVVKAAKKAGWVVVYKDAKVVIYQNKDIEVR